MVTSRFSRLALFFALIVLGVAGRLMPHPWNVTPVAAAALFAGTLLGVRAGMVVPLISMAFSDVFLGIYEWQVMLAVYLSMASMSILGVVVRRYYQPMVIFSSAVVGSFLFFLITNWAVWQFSPWYAKTIEGLLHCYIAALPFWRQSLIGDVFFTVFFFGMYELNRRFAASEFFRHGLVR